MHKIVIVEDELIAAEYLKQVLQNNHFEVLAVIDKGERALRRIPKLNPDIVLMDIMLKDHISGSEVALSLKHTAPDIAVIFLTAYSDDEMIDYAVESNSYGYMIKPYDETNILTTLKITLARLKENKQENTVQMTQKKRSSVYITKYLYFDMEKKRLFQHNKELPLGSKSLAILETLCKQPNVTVSSEQLSLAVWDEPKENRMLRTQISRLKKEIDADIIQNVKGLGYKIVCEV
ncbi:hypothetical protein YH65_08170 [Sulfurovum lithotrophicum]|uniref:DNA-binding response regulator n=1 Tax=Sulfurovum lithotrophicum TaxID=206403 RepID=A0A7U4RR12_9BACT|nr:DNA-binding response regulator [Sulfurovum lithotrophicum]AKF25365.1 hypothetical protein YH65_08170 [Sulfurovum lithotrophicum]